LHHRLSLQLWLRHHRPIEERRVGTGHGTGLHVDGLPRGWLLPFGQELGYDVPSSTPGSGVTSISADTHKYGYALKGTSVIVFRDKACATPSTSSTPTGPGGKYCSPGMDGSRSGA